MIKKIKTLYHGHMLLLILRVKNLLQRFPKKNCKKEFKKSLENVMNYVLNGKHVIVLLIVGLIKKTLNE